MFGWLLVVVSVAVVTPPLQSPDESDHLFRAYLLSTGQWTLATPSNQSSGGLVDEALIAYWERLKPITFGMPETEGEQPPPASLAWSGTERFQAIPGTGYYIPLIYLPQAAALWFGRTLDLGLALSYDLARGLNVLAAASLFLLAFRWIAPNALVLGLIALPMAVFQTASASIDGVCLALTACCIAGFLTIRSDPDAVRPALLAAWCLALIVLVGARLNLAPLLLLPCILLLQRPRWDYFLVTVLTLGLVAAWVLHAAGQVVDLRTAGSAVSTLSRLHDVLLSPGLFLEALSGTLLNPTIVISYLAGFIGVLGWFNLPLPPASYLILGSVLLMTAAASFQRRDDGPPWGITVILIVAALLAILLVFFLLWLTWTTPGSAWIEGVQGRYFLPPALVLAYALGTGGPTYGPPLLRVPFGTVLVASLLMLTLAITLSTVLGRYFPL